MSVPAAQEEERSSACFDCTRRSWLLCALGPVLDYRAGDRRRLWEALALSDHELIQALGGRRRAELAEGHAAFDPSTVRCGVGVEMICRHGNRFPATLRGPEAPAMLNVAGGIGRLEKLTASPVVAILGTSSPSDYGVSIVTELARELAASGATVACRLRSGISLAAHRGAIAGDGEALAVIGGGLADVRPAHARPLYRQLLKKGCAISELPWECPSRRWSQPASERILHALAGLVVVIEARDSPVDLDGPLLARDRGCTLAAVPGRLTSPLSAGTHTLIREGASLIRGTEDALELLAGLDTAAPAPRRQTRENGRAALERRLQVVLESVGAGLDTPERLRKLGIEEGELLLALSELELLGRLRRGEGGRYLACGVLARE